MHKMAAVQIFLFLQLSANVWIAQYHFFTNTDTETMSIYPDPSDILLVKL